MILFKILNIKKQYDLKKSLKMAKSKSKRINKSVQVMWDENLYASGFMLTLDNRDNGMLYNVYVKTSNHFTIENISVIFKDRVTKIEKTFSNLGADLEDLVMEVITSALTDEKEDPAIIRYSKKIRRKNNNMNTLKSRLAQCATLFSVLAVIIIISLI